MTQEEKQLLLKDLCARLPYGVLVKCSDTKGILKYDGYRLHEISEDGSYLSLSAIDIPHGVSNLDLEFCNIKPYLRPMYSMTEEEKKEFQACHCVYDLHPDFQPMMCNIANELNMFDWLNEHHFDCRGLIKKGLALEASEGMYKTK